MKIILTKCYRLSNYTDRAIDNKSYVIGLNNSITTVGISVNISNWSNNILPNFYYALFMLREM